MDQYQEPQQRRDTYNWWKAAERIGLLLIVLLIVLGLTGNLPVPQFDRIGQ